MAREPSVGPRRPRAFPTAPGSWVNPTHSSDTNPPTRGIATHHDAAQFALPCPTGRLSEHSERAGPTSGQSRPFERHRVQDPAGVT